MLIIIEAGWQRRFFFCYMVLSALFKMIHVKELKRPTKTTMPTKTEKVMVVWVCFWEIWEKIRVDYAYIYRAVIGCVSS